MITIGIPLSTVPRHWLAGARQTVKTSRFELDPPSVRLLQKHDLGFEEMQLKEILSTAFGVNEIAISPPPRLVFGGYRIPGECGHILCQKKLEACC